MSGGRMVAISLSTREKYPKFYDFRDMAAIRGRQGTVFKYCRELYFVSSIFDGLKNANLQCVH